MKIRNITLCFVSLIWSIESYPNLSTQEYCQRLSLEQVSIQRRGGRSGQYYLSDGKGELASFNLLSSASFALKTLQVFDLSLLCHLDPLEKLFPFFLNSSGEPAIGKLTPHEQCTSLSENYEIRRPRRFSNRGYFLSALTDQGSVDLYEFPSESQAKKAQELIHAIGFELYCEQADVQSGFGYFRNSI